jgi:DNA-binding CsgD family transcriptional regulator
MIRDEKLSALIAGVYDAALDSALWPRALEGTAAFVGGSGAGLFGQDSSRGSANPYYECGVSSEYRQLYFDKYRQFDPCNAVYFCLEVGDVVSNSQVIRHVEFLETRFYKEWAQPQGFVDNVLSLLEKSSTSAALCAVFRHERDGLADDAARNRMRLLVPHLRRAVLIGNIIEQKTEQAANLTDTLDGVGAGFFLVDSRGHIVHANASAQAMLADGALLNEAAGKLHASDANAERMLHEAFLAANSGDAAVGIKGIAVPLTARDGARHVAHVLPLTSGARRSAGRTYRAAAALFVQKAALDSRLPPEAIAKTYQLTPTELRVLLAIVEVGGVPEVALALGIAESTVKTHLGEVYSKTGANRHADLVKLVAGFASPLA